MRRGFTMIELIFVIVILGILAAVAIPKLAATRDDAKISKGLSEISTAINDFGSYYTSRGAFGKVSDMTNVSSFYTDSAAGTSADNTELNNTTASIYYAVPNNNGDNEGCVKFTFTPDGNITVEPDTTNTGNICTGIQGSNTYKNDLNGTKAFGGKRVTF
ncbi:type II secretion system protein [Hydrogenimonas sp. SS33]|uniref:type II secretion system protein n=1 Tax=Hydrogenimonas leucolamina TaxID=2954236 RepID=UPI00336C0DB0